MEKTELLDEAVPLPRFKTDSIIGVNVAVTNMQDAVNTVCDNLQRLKGEYVCFSNAHTTVTAHDNPDYLTVQNSSYATFPDGKPLSITLRKRGHENAFRVTGPDFMGEVFKISCERGLTHYFFGSTEDTLNTLREKLTESYPGIKIAGMYSPPFSPTLATEYSEETAEKINSANADIVWIGLGAPKQERFMYLYKGKINALMAGVGAGFDYHAGKLKRAPKIMQKLCLEWLYRLLQEPRRLFSRYLKTNTRYIMLNRKQRKLEKKAK